MANKRKTRKATSATYVLPLALIAFAVVFTLITLFSNSYQNINDASESAHYGNMMDYWNYSSNAFQVNASQLGSIMSTSSHAISSNNTLFFNTTNPRIVVLMGPMNENQSMYSFVIDNMTNPTLVFKTGAKVTLFVVNVDTDASHSLAINANPPPYQYNTMYMMMSSQSATPALRPYSGTYIASRISFASAGNAYYICTVAGHAQKGMYGRIVVQQ